jgi:hypothetical protein
VTPEDGYVNKVNPESGRAYPISFQWSKPSENAAGYALEIYTDPEGSNRAFRINANSTSSEVVVNVGPLGVVDVEFVTGATYYWRVRTDPENANGPVYSDWSEMRSFTVEPSRASVPQVASPVNGGTVTTTTPAFSWSPVVGATKYEFQMSEDTVFAAPLAKAELSETGIAPDVELNVGQTYFWRVRAIAPIMGGWSTIANFTVGAPVEAAPPAPAPSPPPQIEVTVPEIEIPKIEIPPQPAAPAPAPAPAPISSGLLWAIIIIGAVLVIALIVLIVRTRRVA